MTSRNTIWFNYQQALDQANKIDDVADSLKSNARDTLGDAMDTVSASWTGSNANSFRNKGATLQGNMEATATKLHSIATEIRRIAQRIYNTEMANLLIAQQRNTGGVVAGGGSGGGGGGMGGR